MLNAQFPILEFDPSRDVIISPQHNKKPIKGISPYCVLCFFNEAIDKFVEKYPCEIIEHFKADGGIDKPIYKVNFNGMKICLTTALLGGPFTAGLLEELHALGMNKFLCIGGAGVLNKEIQHGKLILPTSAIRDEGTSYHYVAPSKELEMNQKIVELIENYFIQNNIPYIKGKTWTTDGFYRETRQKFERRKAEGCVSVEMECASYLAVAQYNKIDFGQILYAGDCLDGEKWDRRVQRSLCADMRYWLLEQAMHIIQKF